MVSTVSTAEEVYSKLGLKTLMFEDLDGELIVFLWPGTVVGGLTGDY
jgi:hypothetical protein